MSMNRLAQAIRRVAQSSSVSFTRTGRVLRVLGTGELEVEVNGLTYRGVPLTDQQYRAGDSIAVTPSGSDMLVHGNG